VPATAHDAAPPTGAFVRNLFLALLLANLLFLAWRQWIAPPDVPAERLRSFASEPPVAALRAVGAPVPAAGTDTSAGDGAPGGCFRIGPLSDGQLADTLRARLAATGATVGLATEDGQVWVGHWVQLESVATREEADQAVARLAAGGLPDAYVLQTAPPFSISLGVFRDRERADAVAAAASRLGFKPRLTDRFRSGLQYWLAVSVPPGRSLPLEQLGRESGQILRAEAVSCGGAIGAAPAIK
jgi:hypothetical protein